MEEETWLDYALVWLAIAVTIAALITQKALTVGTTGL